MLQVSIADNGDYSEITSFYLGVGYSCQLHETDLVIQARENGEVIGAALLGAASDEISHRECWCIPYTHLTQLYGRAGFKKAPKYAEPRFLLDRLTRYSRKGKSVVLLVRPANWRVIA